MARPLVIDSTGSRLSDVALGVGKSAALMGTKRVNGLSAKVIVFKKCIDRHRHGAPIVRIAEIYFIVSVQILGARSAPPGGPFFPQIGFCLGGAGVIIVGIGLRLFYFVKLAFGHFGEYFGGFFGVSDRNSAMNSAKIIFSRTGVKSN